MKSILTPSGLRLLRRFVRTRPLLGFDFDGVLAPMVADPARAGVPPRTRLLLQQVTRLYPCVVISGRARRDVLDRVRGIPVRVIGNHGAEPGAPASVRREVRRWQSLLQTLEVPGIVIEDKGLSVAIHYRRSSRKLAARNAILGCAAQLRDVRIVGGKDVVNLLPLRAPSKGDALERERRRSGRRTAIFIGDDETDEDAFALANSGNLLGIRVGRKPRSLASHYLRSQRDIDRLLHLLILGTMPFHG